MKRRDRPVALLHRLAKLSGQIQSCLLGIRTGECPGFSGELLANHLHRTNDQHIMFGVNETVKQTEPPRIQAG